MFPFVLDCLQDILIKSLDERSLSWCYITFFQPISGISTMILVRCFVAETTESRPDKKASLFLPCLTRLMHFSEIKRIVDYLSFTQYSRLNS